MSQLILENFPKQSIRPIITIDRVFEWMNYSQEYEEPSNREIRLAIELAKQGSPLMFDFYDHVRSILQSSISDARIDKVKSFKDILYKTIITSVRYQNGRYTIKTIEVRRR